MEPDNNREVTDRQPTYQGDRKLSPIQQSAWDSIEQSRRDLSSAAGAIEELTRTLEAFESRRRKPSQHEGAISEVDGGDGEREVSGERQSFFDATSGEPLDVLRSALSGDVREGGEDRSAIGGNEQSTQPAAEQEPEPTAEQTEPTRIVRERRQRSGGLEL